jgi:HEPN domain-containing protein
MNNLEILINNFAIRSFREIADQDYIAARLSYRAQLVPQFLWQGLQALEKYLKCVLVLNRVKAKNGHDLNELLEAWKKAGKFEIRISEESIKFIAYLDKYARFRYYETPYYTRGYELTSLDRAVWEVRRYARVLDYKLKDLNGQEVDLLSLELEANERAERQSPQDCRLIGGILEKIIDTPDHPSRQGLIWCNLYFGKSKRKIVSYRNFSSAGNSPLSLHPEILDEVIKYVFLPKDVIEAYRKLLAVKKKA